MTSWSHWSRKQFIREGDHFGAQSARKSFCVVPSLYTISPINICRCGSLVSFYTLLLM